MLCAQKHQNDLLSDSSVPKANDWEIFICTVHNETGRQLCPVEFTNQTVYNPLAVTVSVTSTKPKCLVISVTILSTQFVYLCYSSIYTLSVILCNFSIYFDVRLKKTVGPRRKCSRRLRLERVNQA